MIDITCNWCNQIINNDKLDIVKVKNGTLKLCDEYGNKEEYLAFHTICFKHFLLTMDVKQ